MKLICKMRLHWWSYDDRGFACKRTCDYCKQVQFSLWGSGNWEIDQDWHKKSVLMILKKLEVI